jgi:hypothetical protein
MPKDRSASPIAPRTGAPATYTQAYKAILGEPVEEHILNSDDVGVKFR